MSRASSSASSSSAASTHSKRRWFLTEEQLLKGLQILGPQSHPLPSDIPPSPPASRESSPVPSFKRRHAFDNEPQSNKRPRTLSSASSSSRPHPPPPSRTVPIASSSKHEPSEEGEVKEEPSEPMGCAPILLPNNFPVRRPKRGKLSDAEWDSIYDKCLLDGRRLKYSANARVAAAHPTTSRDYKPLRVSLSPSSPYATHSLLMARLELLHSLLYFVYAIWCKEYLHDHCSRTGWRSVEEAILLTEKKWQTESVNEREKVFLGLIRMLHAFIHGRKLRHLNAHVDSMNDGKSTRLRLLWQMQQEKEAAEAAKLSTAGPNMLPSPASSSTPNSANSTPLGGHGVVSASPSNTRGLRNGAAPVKDIPLNFPIDVTTSFVTDNKAASSGLRSVMDFMKSSQETLNLPLMARHFPRTFQRMINTSLTAQDEHEPDLQDDDCELYWPGQAIGYEGLGWVCLMGLSMIREFGRAYGYQGVDGIVPRLAGDNNLGPPDPRFSSTK